MFLMKIHQKKIIKYQKKKNNGKSIDVIRYYDWVEIDYIMTKYNFVYSGGDVISENINTNLKATRNFYYIFKNKK